MKRIQTFEKFVAENAEPADTAIASSAQVSNLFSEIQRNYLNLPGLDAQKKSDLNFLEEKRSWPNFIETAKLETNIDAPAKFYLKFAKNGEEFQVTVDFKITYSGIENYDSAVGDYFQSEEDGVRLGVALQKLRIVRVQVKSDFLNFNEQKLLPDLNKTVLGFMLGVLRPEFDLISDESLIIRQL
jgi:hypothetical protein